MDTPLLHIVVASRAVAPQHGFGGLESAAAHHLRGLARRGVRVTVFTQPPDPALPPPEDPGGLVAWRAIPYGPASSARGPRLPLRRNSIPDRLLHYGVFARALGRAIADLARRERVDIVHAHGLTGAGYARAVGRGPRAVGLGEAIRPSGHRAPSMRFTAHGPRPTAHAAPPLVLNPHGLEEFQGRNWAKAVAYAPFRRGLRAAAAAAAAVIATDRAMRADVARRLRIPPREGRDHPQRRRRRRARRPGVPGAGARPA